MQIQLAPGFWGREGSPPAASKQASIPPAVSLRTRTCAKLKVKSRAEAGPGLFPPLYVRVEAERSLPDRLEKRDCDDEGEGEGERVIENDGGAGHLHLTAAARPKP